MLMLIVMRFPLFAFREVFYPLGLFHKVVLYLIQLLNKIRNLFRMNLNIVLYFRDINDEEYLFLDEDFLVLFLFYLFLLFFL